MLDWVVRWVCLLMFRLLWVVSSSVGVVRFCLFVMFSVWVCILSWLGCCRLVGMVFSMSWLMFRLLSWVVFNCRLGLLLMVRVLVLK